MRLAWLWLAPGGLLVATSVVTLGPYRQLTNHGPPFDELPARSAADAAERIARGGAEIRALYRAHHRWDALFMLASASLVATPILVFGTRLRLPGGALAALLLLPCGFVLTDLAENYLIGCGVADEARLQSILAAAPFTYAKFALLCAAVLAAICLLGFWSVRATWRRTRPASA